MIRHQNDILEICLQRLAQGDTIENCLADYAQHAEALRPLLQSAQQVHSLPRQQLDPAADQLIEKRLRTVVRRREDSAAAGLRPSLLEVMMKSVMRLLPRVALGIGAVGLIIFLLAQLPFWRSPEVEPMVAETAIAVPGNESELDLSADPGQVPLYRVWAEPVPDTPEALLAWARDFGLPDPALYERPSGNDPSLYVIGSDGRRLNFSSDLSSGDIFYTNPQAVTSGDPLPFAQASQIAVAFLREHTLLPESYQVDEPLFAPQTNGWQSIIVRATLANGIIGELNDYGAGQTVIVAADGQIAHASLRRLTIEMADESVAIISAQAAYEKLLAGEVSASAGGGGGNNPMGTSYEPPTNWQVGQEVALIGGLELFVGVEDGRIQATLSGPGSARYQLTGSRITELAEDTWREAYLIEGIITEQISASVWQLEVWDWQHVAYDDGGCLTGELKWQADMARFHSDEGNEYGLPQAPAEIGEGERLQVCFSLSDEPGTDLRWSVIYVPPLANQVSFGGSSMTAQEVVVEREVVSVVEVTRIVTPMVEMESETAVSPSLPVPPLPVLPAATGASFTPPESPHEMGDRVEITGYVQGIRIVNDADSSRLELQLINDIDNSDAPYSLPYPLLAPEGLMEEMAAFIDLHIRVQGEIVPAPESKFFGTSQGQAIAVESFDRPWPDEKLENFLGHFSVEEIEGRRYMVFTDHTTDQRYVVDPQYDPPPEHVSDVRFSDEQGLLTGIIHPAAAPIGGLPVMLNRGYATGPEISLATDASQFPLPTDRLGTINESFLSGNEIGENDIIERVELVYPYSPYGNETGAQMLEPVWVFYGRNADSTQFFTITVQAVK